MFSDGTQDGGDGRSSAVGCGMDGSQRKILRKLMLWDELLPLQETSNVNLFKKLEEVTLNSVFSVGCFNNPHISSPGSEH